MKKNSNIIWGVVLVALGIFFGLNSFGVLDVDLFFDGWWTLLIIVPSVITLFTTKDKTFSIIGIAVGVLLLLVCREIITFDLIRKLSVPLIFVIVGLGLMLKSSLNPAQKAAFETVRRAGGKLPEHGGVFSSQDIRFDDAVFEGADLTAAFGGVTCDASKAIISKDCLVNCSAIFGGIDLFVPQNVNVVIRSTSLFGGISDKRVSSAPVSGPTVYVNALCLFGGVDIK